MDSDTTALKFPDYFPPECPPEEAEEREIEVYRLCRKNKVMASDFESFYQKRPEKFQGMIESYGLSVFPSKKDCEKAQQKSPNLRRFRGCSHGITYKYTGKILNTPNHNNPSHITWWLYEGVEPHTYFQLCDTGDDD